MPDKVVRKIAGLIIGVDRRDTKEVFYFSGTHAAVREATRDACYGLNIPENIEEALNLEPKVPAGLPGPVTYKITLSIDDFDRLVQMHRYCKALGVTFPPLHQEDWMTEQYVVRTREGGLTTEEHLRLPQYMAEVARVAAHKAAEPLVVPTHEKPPCSLLWTREELEQEEAGIRELQGILDKIHMQRHEVSTNSFFPAGGEKPASESDIRNTRIDYLLLQMEQLLRRHPAARYGIEGVARSLMDSWLKAAQEGVNTSERLFFESRANTRVQSDDEVAFIELATKYVELMKPVSNAASSVPVMS